MTLNELAYQQGAQDAFSKFAARVGAIGGPAMPTPMSPPSSVVAQSPPPSIAASARPAATAIPGMAAAAGSSSGSGIGGLPTSPVQAPTIQTATPGTLGKSTGDALRQGAVTAGGGGK